MKGELVWKIMTKFAWLRAKAYSYLIDNGSEGKKAKGRKKCVVKRKLKFENCKNCLEATKLDSKINYLEENKVIVYSFKKDHKEFIKTVN